ncbi:MAG: phosphotransferase [Dokdonella sp.]
MQLAKAQWADLIPHKGTMCLLDAVESWDSVSIHATSQSHRMLDNPLRSDDRLRALHLCEYGAQAMAVHGALLAQSNKDAARPGYLVALRAVDLQIERIDDLPGALEIHAECLLSDQTAWQYAFRVHHAGHMLASGRATVMLRD